MDLKDINNKINEILNEKNKLNSKLEELDNQLDTLYLKRRKIDELNLEIDFTEKKYTIKFTYKSYIYHSENVFNYIYYGYIPKIFKKNFTIKKNNNNVKISPELNIYTNNSFILDLVNSYIDISKLYPREIPKYDYEIIITDNYIN